VHILVKFLLLILLALLIAKMHWPFLGWLGLGMVFVSWVFYRQVFYKMLKRIKWLVMFMMLIYAYSIPGEYLPFWLVETRPTYEGLMMGVTQSLKIVTMLAGLAMLLGSSPPSKLIGGIYQAALPMRWLGFNVNQFTTRLWLTLHYVETQGETKHRLSEVHTFLVGMKNEMLAELNMDSNRLISIQVTPLSHLDKGWLLSIIVVLIGVWGWL
jgi:energy-coupling factor transport system permease protein